MKLGTVVEIEHDFLVEFLNLSARVMIAIGDAVALEARTPSFAEEGRAPA